MPLLLRVGSAVSEQILFRRRAARLHIAQQIVKGIVRRHGLLVRQVFYSSDIALRVVGIDISIQSSRQADICEHGRVRISSIEHANLNAIVRLRRNNLDSSMIILAAKSSIVFFGEYLIMRPMSMVRLIKQYHESGVFTT